LIKHALDIAPINTAEPILSIKDVLQPSLVESLRKDEDPIAVKISHNLFINA